MCVYAVTRIIAVAEADGVQKLFVYSIDVNCLRSIFYVLPCMLRLQLTWCKIPF